MNAEPHGAIFLDTNILVYAFDLSAGEKHTRAAGIVRDCWENENGCLSIQVLQELYVTLTQKIPALLDHHTARQIIADLSCWRLSSPGPQDVLQAIDLQHAQQLSFWDAMILQSAVRLGCKRLLSEDLSHRQVFGSVTIINPFAES
jgi:predicted nucleic acid-binding protein